MRVLQVITGLNMGGAERLLLQLAEALDSTRFDTRIVSLTSELGALSSSGVDRAKVTALDFRRQRLRSLRDLAKLIDAYEPQVIHAHMFHALLAVAMALPLTRSKPALCFTGHRTVHAPFRRAFLRLSKRLRAADIVFSKDVLSAVDARHTVVIPNGVEMEDPPSRRRSWGGERRRLISVGRLIDIKGCLELVRAYAAARLDNTELVFVGTGPLAAPIESLARELGVAEHVKLPGFSDNVRVHLRDAHVFVMHSRQEGMPIALLEAGAEGLPAIATPVGSIPSLLADKRGILATGAEFAGALRHVIDHPEEALAMGARLQDYVAAHHAMATVATLHERLYASLVR